ncbi:hypothetical protein CMK18_15855 [Candidatus Poribacteria bacterium]|nr:hypothetical protein [Candidatus Poribacteria bacterium]
MPVFNKNRFSVITTLLIILQLVFLLSSCSNSNLPTAENDGILVTGSATIQSSPDLATLRVGVQSFDKNVEKAVNDNNTKIESIILNLENKGLTEKDMETDQFNISPQREYRNNSPPIVVGYNVSNILTVKIRNLESLGEIMQVTVGSGANTINGLSFSIEDPNPLRQKARGLAMEDALSRAEILADASGVEVGKPISIQELSYGGPVVKSENLAGAEFAMDARIPIQTPSEVGIQINLQVRFEIK